MPERVKKTKCGGRGCSEKKLRGRMPVMVKKTKCTGAAFVAKKNLRGYAGEGKEDKMRGWLVKIGGGGLDHKKNLGGGQWKIMSS